MVIINDYEPLHVKMGRTLIVSGVGLLVILLSTLVLVPLNGFWMNKKLGAGLILAYTVR
jgi:solute carrier family 24 (sodium/potassium/calcium exchanger), member 6